MKTKLLALHAIHYSGELKLMFKTAASLSWTGNGGDGDGFKVFYKYLKTALCPEIHGEN